MEDDPDNWLRKVRASRGEALATTKAAGGDSVERHGLGSVHEEMVAFALGCPTTREKTLNQESCDVDVENKCGKAELLVAAHQDRWGTVESLLFAGENINKADRHGNTALHICLMKMHQHPTERLDMPTSPAMKAVEKTIREHHQADVSERLLVACFLARMGADIRFRNNEDENPLDIALGLKEPAVELLGFSAVEGCFADTGKCRCCLEAVASTSFMPCGHCLYCDDCGHRMKRCLACGKFIVERVSNCRSPTFNHNYEKIEVIKATKPRHGPQIYRMEKKPRGMCIIINNIDFQDPSKQREGSYLDVQNMEFLFTALHFNVAVKTNLDAGDMLLEFVRASYAEGQQHADCLVVILMSYGEKDVICGVDGKKLNLDSQVYSLFNNSNCPDLEGKPKLFFVQSCRDSDSQDVTEDVRGTSDTSPTAAERSAATSSEPCNRIPGWSDMYIAHAIIPDYVALKSKPIGSWFLSAVSQVFSDHAWNMPLDSLMAKVMERCSQDRNHQTPRIIKYGWQKELYFNPGIYA